MGCVYLLGAGPGDPELLTVRAARILSRADAVLYDELIQKPILDLAPAKAERLYVGKRAGCHAAPQAEIISWLVERARQGKMHGTAERRRSVHFWPWGRGSGSAQRGGSPLGNWRRGSAPGWPCRSWRIFP